MNKKMLVIIATLILLGAAFATYVLWQYNHPKSETTQVTTARASPAARAVDALPDYSIQLTLMRGARLQSIAALAAAMSVNSFSPSQRSNLA